MLPHLDTESQISRMRRQETLAKAERYGAARGAAGHDGDRRTPGPLRQRIGVVLVQVGQRLQGTRSVAPAVGSASSLAITGTSR